MTTTSTLLAAAPAVRRLGGPLVPNYGVDANGVCRCKARAQCPNPGKHPCIENWPNEASDDPAKIAEWSRMFPHANAGMATGHGLLALDVDPANGGSESLRDLERQYGPLPHTPRQITGGGGEHHIFRVPIDLVFGNSASKIADGLDIRTDGGQIIVEPSRTDKGAYSWDAGAHPDDTPVADAPAWLLKLLMATVATEAAASGSGTGGKLSLSAKGFIANGAPIHQQNDTACRVARSLLNDSHLSVAAATDLLLLGLQAAAHDPKRGPWTYADAHRIVTSMAASPPKPKKPLPQAPLVGVPKVGTNGHGADHSEDDPSNEPPPDEAPPDVTAQASESHVGECSDVGNAAMFRSLWTGKVLYDHRSADWWLFEGHWWRRDGDGEVVRLARETIRQRQVNAVRIADDDARSREMKWAAGSLSRKRIADMITLAQSEPGIADDGDGWDAEPLLIAFENGVYDARIHVFRDGKPADRIRTHAPTFYDPGATAPVFERFMADIAPDADVRALLQRFLGYAATGDVSEQKMVIGIGPRGSNGKTTLAECMAGVMGPYVRAAAPDMLLTRKHDAHPTELADLQGARLVTSIEVEHGRRLAESRVKHLTGGDVIKARRMRENFSDFAPTHKLILLCNHMPVITSSDEAIWRRLLVVEFSTKFADRPGPGERKTDPHLGAKLAAERAGIVNWLIAGLKDWQARRLDAPASVVKSTKKYRTASDPLAAYFEEVVIADPVGTIKPSEAYIAYRGWAATRWQKDSEIISETVFGTMMGERFTRVKVGPKGAQYRAYKGLRLRAEGEVETDDEG